MVELDIKHISNHMDGNLNGKKMEKCPEQVEKQPMHWKVWGLCKVSKYHDIAVLHVPQKKFKSTALRLLGFIYWHIVSFFIGLTIKHVDLILSPSPPLTVGWMNLGLAKLKGCKVIYNVQEIYPDILKLKGGFVLKFLRWMERKVYNGSDAVTTIDKVFYDTIEPRFEDKSKLHIIPNFVDTALYRALSSLQVNSLLDLRLRVLLIQLSGIGVAQAIDHLCYSIDARLNGFNTLLCNISKVNGDQELVKGLHQRAV